jgi:hypothetical protein
MEEQSILHLMENWGYYLLPKSHPDSPGYTGLLVAIRKQPTEKHFDPQSMRLRLRDKYEQAKWTTLWLHSPVELPIKASIRACPGEVILRDRTDKRADFFVFGGSLEAVSVPGETVYSLRSPAPILQLTDDPESVPDQFASETEALIGELQVRWGSDEEGFALRLAQVDPFQFYLATLQSLIARYEREDHHALQDAFHEFYFALRNEKRWLEERRQWPAILPTLEELLASDG